jgi:eukaryotic-like serine/threonine-protein kinase
MSDSGGVKNWSKVENLFHSALALPPHARADFLKQACQNDSELLRETQALLDRAQPEDSFLENSPLASPANTPILSPGVLLGLFEIEALLGEGGMGEVYRARDTRLDRVVAIKRSPQQFSSHFQREARAVAALNHPHICTLYDIGPDYLVIEFIEGETLQSRLARGPLPLDSALPLAIQLLAALETAHGKGKVL